MSLFHNRFRYIEPERLSAEEARQRRTLSALEKARKELEVREERLSQANKFHLNQLKEFEFKFGNEIESRVKRHEKMAESAAKDRSKSRLFQLLQRQHALRQRAQLERAQKEQKSFVDRAYGLKVNRKANVFVNALGRHFVRGLTKTRLGLLPCVERIVRREVMFAKGHGGKGHRSPHHKGPLSHIGC